MYVVYGLLAAGAVAILYLVWSTQETIPVKTWIQAGIMIVVGLGGLLIMQSTREREGPPA